MIENALFIWLLVIVAIWEAVWKGIALWRTGRSNKLAWFICIFIFNTLGILPIVYLFFFDKKKIKKKK